MYWPCRKPVRTQYPQRPAGLSRRVRQYPPRTFGDALEHHRRQQLIITALEKELVTIDLHITEAQKERAKIENKAAHLANTVLEEKWNEAAKALMETGGKLWAARRLISQDPVGLLKLEIPEQGENFGSWTFRELAERSHQHSLLDLLAA